MVNPLIKRELEEQLNRLPVEMQRRVLNYAFELATRRPKGVKGATLVKFAGEIPAEDLQTMARAIEQDCEQVDLHEW